MPSVCSLAITLALFAVVAQGQQQQPALNANQIMARVAANQDRSESARAHFVYVQHARVFSRKGSTIRCEELTDTRITPTPTGSHQQLLTLNGRLLHKGSYITYNRLPAAAPAGKDAPDTNDPRASIKAADNDDTTDLDLVENMRDNLLGNKSGHAKDGINDSLFPLTSKQQADYEFTLVGREPRNGRDTFHIQFRPKDKSDFGWKGDAWIDTTTFQPVVIRTALSRRLPLGVRVLLGTNVPGIGFTVIYAPQPANQPGNEADPVWFPVSLGSEFKIHVLFFFSRQIVIAAENRDFEKTHVTSTILTPGQVAVAPPQP
ncbi:MAG TPA: hypothetical protein VGM11_06350 [Acidobacteriaceae bacterium]|jgi:hypothetical protein